MKLYRWLTLIAAVAIAVIEAMMFTSGTTAAPQAGPQITVVAPGTAAAAPLPADRTGTGPRLVSGTAP